MPYEQMVTRFVEAYDAARLMRDEETKIQSPFPPFQEVTNLWELCWNAYAKGDFWSLFKRMPGWKSRPSTNFPFIAVETNTTMLTDSRPAVRPISESDLDADFYLAEALKARHIKWFSDQYGDMKVAVGVKTSRIFGLGWWTLNYIGKEQVWENVHLKQILVSPDTTWESFLVREPSYLIYEYEMQLGEIKTEFPKSDFAKTLDFSRFNPAWTPGTEESTHERALDDENRMFPNKTVKVYQFWQQDADIIEWEDELEGTDEVAVKTKKRYPGGRVVTIGGGMVLDDRANPNEHRMYPFIPIPAYFMPGRFYPVGDVQNILPPSIMYNRTDQLLFDGTMKAGGAKVLLGQGSGLSARDWTNAPYQVIECEDVSQVRVESPGEPPRHVYNYKETTRRDIDDIMGIHDTSKGAKQPGNTSATEAQIISESDRTRVRLASRALTWSLDRLARMWVYNVAQYDAEREMVAPVAQLPASEENPPAPGFEGRTEIPVPFSGKDLLSKGSIKEGLKVSLRFVEYSTLPEPMRDDMQASSLYDRNLIDAEDYLTAINWPNARATAMKANKRIEAEKAAALAAAQAQGGGMPNPLGPIAPGMDTGGGELPMGGSETAMGGEDDPLAGLDPEMRAMVEEMMGQGMSPEEAVAQLAAMAGGV